MSGELLEVGTEEAGQRLDRLLATRRPERSRAGWQALIRAGHVLVQGAPARPSQLLRGGERISIQPPPERRLPPEPGAEQLPLELLHCDDELAVVVKPPGLVVHPAPGHPEGTLVNALLARLGSLPSSDDRLKPGIVHRLDKDTSGLMVVARSQRSLAELQRQFAAREVRKTYLALVIGGPQLASGRIEARIGRSRGDRKRMQTLRSGGRSAETLWRVRERLPGTTLLEVDLKTGRTHQIRVHLAASGWPVVGDGLYGGGRLAPGVGAAVRALIAAFPRQALHAWRLGFRHPVSGEPLAFEAKLPGDMAELLAELRRAVRG